MKSAFMFEKRHWWARIGFILLIPSFILVIAGVLFSVFNAPHLAELIDANVMKTAWGKYIDNPVTILGGIFLAFILNVLPLLHITFSTEEQSMILLVSLKDRIWNALTVMSSIALGSVILLYAFGENFMIVAR